MKLNHNFRLNKKNVVSILILLLCVIISMSAVSAGDNTNDSSVMSANSQDDSNLISDSVSDSDSASDSDSLLSSVSESESISESLSENEKSDNINVIKESKDNSVLKDDGKPYIYIASDKIINSEEDIKFMQDIQAEIGDRATVVIDPNSPNPNEVSRTIKNAGKGIAVYIANFCSGTTYDLVQYGLRGYLSQYSSNLDGVCFVYYGTIPVKTTEFIARAWDDNFSDEFFAGLYSPYKYITEGGLGFIQARANGDSRSQMIKTIAEGLLSYAKTANKQHLSTDNLTEILNYVARHDFSPVELANDANNLLNGKSTQRKLQDWIYYTAQYVGALPIKTTTKTFSLPTTFSASTLTNSLTLSRVDYRTLALQIKEYMDKNGVAPAYITYNGKNININDYCYMLAKIISGHTDKSKFIFANSFTVVKSPVSIIVSKNVISLKSILTASVSLKKYITKYKKLPSTIKVGGIKMTLSEYLYLASKATVNINKKVLSAIAYKKFTKKVKKVKKELKVLLKNQNI